MATGVRGRYGALLPGIPDARWSSFHIHWHGFDTHLPIGRLGRLTFHRQKDVALLKSITHDPSGMSEFKRWKKELMVLKLKEEWRTGQEDQILERLYRTLGGNEGKTARGRSARSVDHDPRTQEILHYEESIDNILRISRYHTISRKPEVKGETIEDRFEVNSFPHLLTMDLIRQNKFPTSMERLVECINGFRRILRTSKQNGKSGYKAILDRVAASRGGFGSYLKAACAKVDGDINPRTKADAKRLQRIAATHIASKIEALKAHSMARIIQRWYRRKLYKRRFKENLAKIRRVSRFCRRHAAHYRIWRSAVVCQCYFQSFLVQTSQTEAKRRYRIQRRTELNTAWTIIKWYRYWSLLRRSKEIWLKKIPDARRLWYQSLTGKGWIKKRKNIIVIQSLARVMRAKKIFFFKRLFQAHRKRRAWRSKWKELRKLQIVRDIEENMVLTKYYVAREKEKASREVEKEHLRFAAVWKSKIIKADSRTHSTDDLKRSIGRDMLAAQRQLNYRMNQIAAFSLRLKNGQGTKLNALEKKKWELIRAMLRKEAIAIKEPSLMLNEDGTIKQ